MIILRTRNEYKFTDEGMNISWKKKKNGKKKKIRQLVKEVSMNQIYLSLSSFQWDSGNLDRTLLLLQ